MKKRSIGKLFAMLEGMPENGSTGKPGKSKLVKADASKAQSQKENLRHPSESNSSAAEKLGRALLDRLGGIEGLTEAELTECIIRAWGNDPTDSTAAEQTAAFEPTEAFSAMPQNTPIKDDDILARQSAKRRPTQVRAVASQETPTDYTELSAEQFRKLKRQLQRASADGRRVRL